MSPSGVSRENTSRGTPVGFRSRAGRIVCAWGERSRRGGVKSDSMSGIVIAVTLYGFEDKGEDVPRKIESLNL